MGGGAEVPWNGPPERVTAPYVVPQPNEQVFEESGCFVLQPQAGDKLLKAKYMWETDSEQVL